MYAILKTIHSYWAYFTLLILILAVLNSLVGYFAKKEFSSKDLRIALFALIFSHIQFLIGIILYFVSPWFDQWSSGNVMQDATARLYLVEHPLTNIIAIAFITVGWSLHKRQEASQKKFSRIAIFYFLGLVLLLSRIPWDVWF